MPTSHGETRPQFEDRCRAALQAQELKVKARFAREIARLQAQLDRVQARKLQLEAEVLQAGETLLGLVTGRKRSLRPVVGKHRASQAARGKQLQAGEELIQLLQRLQELRDDERLELERVRAILGQIEQQPVRPKRSDIRVLRSGVLWLGQPR